MLSRIIRNRSVQAGRIKIRLGAVLENRLLYLVVEMVISIGAWPRDVKTLNHWCPMILVPDVGRRDIGEISSPPGGVSSSFTIEKVCSS